MPPLLSAVSRFGTTHGANNPPVDVVDMRRRGGPINSV